MVSFKITSVSVILASLAMVQSIAADGGIALSLGDIKIGLRSDTHEQAEFWPCQQAAEAQEPKPTYTQSAPGELVINGVPSICIDLVAAHNKLPNIDLINKWEGSVEIVNSTAIRTSGVGNKLAAYLDDFCVLIQ